MRGTDTVERGFLLAAAGRDAAFGAALVASRALVLGGGPSPGSWRGDAARHARGHAARGAPGDRVSDPATPQAVWRAVVREAPTLRPAPEGEEEWFALPLAAHARRRRRSLAAVGLDALKAQSPR